LVPSPWGRAKCTEVLGEGVPPREEVVGVAAAGGLPDRDGAVRSGIQPCVGDGCYAKVAGAEA